MDKLILIDGNSLLNRAFYAMRVFSTKDGLPTNGIFGFTKLILKIIEDEKPTHFAVAFDVHAPTFRHKMYSGYKATRKPMPEELAAQVPVLKELLRSMNICIVELAGYEADDVIGTLSRRFEGVEVLIYTGDRDSYQLVKENVSVCFTKRGVSDLDRLTKENFFEKTGLYPYQIIEEKSLMGDSSDNIPGVHGIGGKTATELLQRYGDMEGVYAHLHELSPSLRGKLQEGRDMAVLSKQLATIDLVVPLTVNKEDCVLTVPFPAAARAMCQKLEFRSLLVGNYFTESEKKVQGANSVEVSDLTQWLPTIENAVEFAYYAAKDAVHVYCNGTEYLFHLRESLLADGYFPEDLKPAYERLFMAGKRAYLADGKALAHELARMNVALSCEVEDVSLLLYIADSNNRVLDVPAMIAEYGLPADNMAYCLKVVYDEAMERLRGTDEEKIYREIEAPLARVLYDMERTGVRIDEAALPKFSEKFRAELEELTQKIYSLAGRQFNLNSPFQLSDVLFGDLGFSAKGVKKNIRGGYSTSAEVLEKLAEEHEIVRLILRYREVQKLQSTYIDGLKPYISGGIVHTTYNQTITTTGRLSSANPNLQNIPVRTDEGKELRKLFIAREGNILIDADYSQIELRLLAHCSGAKALLQSYQNGDDVHAATAARVFGVPISAVTSLQRRRAKTVNFGIIYGMGAFGLSKDIGCSTKEAQDYLDKYFSAHPEVKEFMEENVRFAKEHGYVTTIFGRKRYIPELKSSNANLRAFGERAAMNMPLQGSAADIIKIAMQRVYERLKRENLRTKMVLQVHDELVLDAPLEEADVAEHILKEEMEGAISLKVPLIADVARGRSWYDAK